MSDPVALRAWRLYVEDMVSFIDKALVYVQGIDRAAFPLDSMRYDATLRNLELIGEAALMYRSRFERWQPMSHGAWSSRCATG